MHDFDVAHELNVQPPERLLDPALVGQHAEAIIRMIRARLEVAADGRVLAPRWSAPEVVAERQSLRLRFDVELERPPGAIALKASLFPYDANHQTFVNIYEGDGLTQAILDRQPGALRILLGHASGDRRRDPTVRACRNPPHPDRPRPSAFSRRAAAARRDAPAAGAGRDRLHGRAQPHAVPRRAEPGQPAGAAHRTRNCAQHCLRWRGQSAGTRRPGRACLDRVRVRVHPRVRVRQRPARDGSAATGAGVVAFFVQLRRRTRPTARRLARRHGVRRASRSEAKPRAGGCWYRGSIVVVAAGSFWFVQRVFFPGGMQ